MTNDSLVHVKDRMFDNGQTASQEMASRIMADLRRCLPDILKHRPVLLAYAYGSVAAGCPTPLSDVDIALVLAPDCGLDAYQRFMLELEIAAEIERHCDIQNADVRSINDAPLRVQGQVLTRGRLLYSKDVDFRVAYEVRTRKRYFDFQPVLAMMCEAYFAHLEADLRKKALYGQQFPFSGCLPRIYTPHKPRTPQGRHSMRVSDPREQETSPQIGVLTSPILPSGAREYTRDGKQQ